METQEIARNFTPVHNASHTAGMYRDGCDSPQPKQIRVLSIDSHPLVQCGIASILQSQPDMIFVGGVSSANEALERFYEYTPDVILIDLDLPDCLTAISTITSERPEARFIVMTDYLADVEIHRVLTAGVRACVLTNMPPNELLASVRQVHAGKK